MRYTLHACMIRMFPLCQRTHRHVHTMGAADTLNMPALIHASFCSAPTANSINSRSSAHPLFLHAEQGHQDSGQSLSSAGLTATQPKRAGQFWISMTGQLCVVLSSL